MVKYSEAKKLGIAQYNGKFCTVHPENLGRRRTVSGQCTVCHWHQVAERKKQKRHAALAGAVRKPLGPRRL